MDNTDLSQFRREEREWRKKGVMGILPGLIVLSSEVEGEIYGYQIMKGFLKKFGVTAGPSKLYGALKTLEEEGLLNSECCS
jgi:DNA-binding PadR family transcriptional regulator